MQNTQVKNNSKYTFWILLLSCIFFVCAVVFFSGCSKNKDPGSAPSDELVDEKIVKDVVFHDQGDVYLSDFEPTDSESVDVRLRVRRGNATNVYVEWTTELDKASGADINWQKADMQFEYTDPNQYYDYYKGTIPAQTSAYRYHFVIQNNVETVYYAGRNIENAKKDSDGSYSNPFDGFSNDFLIQVNFSTPDWSKGALWYSAMPDSFFNGDPTNDKYGGPIGQTPWGGVHTGGLDYFGGDMQGLYEKIDYLQELNCTGLFINPLWLANHNAGYGFFDGTLLDSTFGNEQLLKELTDELHKNGIRIMFDGVFNYFIGNSKYVNSSSLWPTEGKASSDSSSKYYDVFMRDTSGNLMTNQFGYVVDFASEDAQKLIYSDANSIMQYYILNCGIDGWRLDSAILYTASDGRTGTQIIQDMRKYLKEVAPDSLLCLENANEAGMYTDYAADTYWNQRFLSAVKAFIDGNVNKSTLNLLSSNLYEAVLGLPRAVAHSSYNMLTNHDEDRILYLMDGDVNKAQSLYLMVMTYMGSPTIFYGEEVGINSANRFFVGMNWDRSTWDYDIYHLIKALSQFRAENEELFKYGILENLGVDETNLLMKYRRSYADTQMMTILNPTGEVKRGVEIDVHSMEVKDGEAVYDYLSGNRYTVNEGTIKIDVMPYGALLTNKSGNGWAGKWEVVGSGTGEVRQTGEESYAVSGEGSLAQNRYAVLPIYNTAGLEFEVKGNAVVVMQSEKGGGNYYGVEIRGTEGVIKAKSGGSEEEVARFTVTPGEKLVLRRGANNEFSVARAGGEAIEGSEKYVSAGYEMYCGIGSLSGDGEVNGLKLTEEEPQRATDFETETDAMMETQGDEAAKEIEAGVLRLNATEEGVYTLTHAPMRDYSVKAQLSGSPKAEGDAMGVTVWQSENCFIFAGRAFVDGESQIVFAQSVNGTLFFQSVLPDVSGSIVLQLERTGVNWVARYRADSEKDFVSIGTHMIANFSDMYAGVFNKGTGTAEYDYFCFGDAIQDGTSLSAHAGYGKLQLDNVSYGSYGLVAYKTDGGNWEIVNGGVMQTDKNTVSAVYRAEQTLQYFRADYSIDFIETSSADAFVAFRFGSSAENYSVRLYADGTLELLKGKNVLRSAEIEDFEAAEPTRIFIEYSDGQVLTVMTGGVAKVAFSVVDFESSSGSLSWEGSKASFRISSYQCMAYSDNYPIFGSVSAVNDAIYNPNSSMSVVSEGITDFVLSFDLAQFQRGMPADEIYFGFVLGGSVGYRDSYEGAMIIGMDLSKEVFISIGGDKVVTAQLSDELEIGEIHFEIVVQDKNIRIFAGALNGQTELVLEYTDQIVRGGAFTFESVNARTRIENVFIYGLRSDENYLDAIA